MTYNNTLITRIKSIDNYKANMKVCYINEFNKNEEEIYLHQAFKRIYTDYYSHNTLINNYEWKRFMAFYNGFNPALVDENKYIDDFRVKNMTVYPDDGSIKVIDDVVVVKFK